MKIKRRTQRKFTAILLNFLLIFSLFIPQTSYAETNPDIDLNTIEEDLELEKELEEKEEKQKKNSDKAKDADDASEADGNLTPRLDDIQNNDSEQDDAHLEEANELAAEHNLIDLFAEADELDVIIHMKDADSTSVNELDTESLTRTERITKVQEHLQGLADKSQANILKELDKLSKQDAVSDIQPLWIVNGIAATVTKEAYEILLKRNDVEKVLQDETYEVPEPQESETEPRLPERSEEHTSELQSRGHLVCRLLLEKKKIHRY